MLAFLRKSWPFILALVLFLAVSWFVQLYLPAFRGAISESSLPLGMLLYVLLGIVTVMIPFGTLLPFIPLAVSLFGWQVTALLTELAWVLGSQMLFEFSRDFGRPVIDKYVSTRYLHHIARLIEGKGILQALFIRMVAHGDTVSYAFGMFTKVSRTEFLIVTAIGVAPGAFMYAYFGSLPFQYQLGLLAFGISMLLIYILLELKKPAFLRKLRL